MIRMGFYSGKLYRDDKEEIEECSQMLNYKEPVTDDDEYVVRKRAELKIRCNGCMGCPMALKDAQSTKEEESNV